MHSLQQLLNYLRLDLIQFSALLLGVAEVLLARANNVLLYPAGISAIILSSVSLYNAQLYAECILQLYYLIMSIYGWKYWLTRQGDREISITFSSRREWLIAVGIVAASWILLYIFLVTFTTSDVPVWDSWVSATAWAGMWLLARRKAENWILLNISNAFAIPLLYHKNLPMLAILTIILFVVACKGYFDWCRKARVYALSR